MADLIANGESGASVRNKLNNIGPLANKLRRLARAAAISNPIDRPPLLAVPAYANSTTVLAGQALVRNNNVYIVVTDGMTAASGGPSTTTSGDAIADGSTFLSYFGSKPRVADDAEAPSVSLVTTNPDLAANWLPVANPGVYRVLGASPVTFRTNLWELQTFIAAPAGSPVMRAAEVTSITDALKFAIHLPANSCPSRVIIDGQYLSLGSYNPGGSDSWLVIDYTTTGLRKFRTITVQTNKSFSYFGGIQTLAEDQVMAPPTDDTVRAVICADSLEAGGGPGPALGGGAPGTLWGKLTGIDDVWLLSTGNTGDIANNGGASYDYSQRAAQIIALNPAVVVVPASTNDIGQTQAALTAKRLSFLQTLRAGLPNAILVNEGCWPKNDAGVATVEAAISAAVAAFNDPLCFFVPRFTETPPWVTSSNRNLMIASDGTHPADIGSHQIARQRAKGWRKYVLPNLPG